MKRFTLLLIWALTILLLACRAKTDTASLADNDLEPDGSDLLVVDTVKTHKDPKSGWFGPKLRDVYQKGTDTPVLYCDDGPEFPIGKPITVFYVNENSTPEQSPCKKPIGVAEGRAEWINGKAIPEGQIIRIPEQEKHFHDYILVRLDSKLQRKMSPAWNNPSPIGDPCPDVSGAPGDIVERYQRKKCSIIVVNPNGWNNSALFVNWYVTGIDGISGENNSGPSISPDDVLQTITSRYGNKYVVTR
jgi:hypothetical protein